MTKHQKVAPNRTIELGYVAFRVYRPDGKSKDKRGTYDGWSAKYDEWMPIISPLIFKHKSKTRDDLKEPSLSNLREDEE